MTGNCTPPASHPASHPVNYLHAIGSIAAHPRRRIRRRHIRAIIGLTALPCIGMPLVLLIPYDAQGIVGSQAVVSVPEPSGLAVMALPVLLTVWLARRKLNLKRN